VKLLQAFFDFYLKSSIHVALMVLCMFEITRIEWGAPIVLSEQLFVFLASLAAYNFVKYSNLIRVKFNRKSKRFITIVLMSFLSLLAAAYFLFFFSQSKMYVVLVATLLLLLYVVPLNSSSSNLRTVGGVKIHIVALCWTLITGVLPLIDEVDIIEISFWLILIQRYLWIILALLPFEIADFSTDDKALSTLPQVLGKQKTKFLGYILAILVVSIAFKGFEKVVWCYLVMMLLYVFFLGRSSEDQHPNTNAFWVEGIPFIGWLILYLPH